MFWKDIWLEEVPLHDLALSPIPSQQINKTVAEYWDTGWKWDLFSELLPAACLNKAATTIIYDDLNDEDTTGWVGESNGRFTVSSAYTIAANEGSSVEATKWNSIWKLKIPNRIKTYIWLVRHDKILTNSNRCRRGMSGNDRCWNCANTAEDADHFRDNSTCPFREWLDKGISIKNSENTPGDIRPLFAITLWWLWKWRNEAIFSSKIYSLHYKVNWILTQWAEVNTAFAKAENQHNPDNQR